MNSKYFCTVFFRPCFSNGIFTFLNAQFTLLNYHYQLFSAALLRVEVDNDIQFPIHLIALNHT